MDCRMHVHTYMLACIIMHTHIHIHTHIHTQMYIHARTHTHTHTHTHGCTCLFFVPIFTMCQLFRASLCAHHLFCFLQTATALAAAVGWGEAPRAAVSKAWSHVRPYFAPSHTLSSLSFGLALMFDSPPPPPPPPQSVVWFCCRHFAAEPLWSILCTP